MTDQHAIPPFHLAFEVHCLEATREFYSGLLECVEARSSERWVDFNFFGHQISAHLVEVNMNATAHNVVDGDAVPARHFGAVLDWSHWQSLKVRLQVHKVPFIIEPRIRFEGEVGEQATMFIRDPSGNALEFKSFRDPARLFAR